MQTTKFGHTPCTSREGETNLTSKSTALRKNTHIYIEIKREVIIGYTYPVVLYSNIVNQSPPPLINLPSPSPAA